MSALKDLREIVNVSRLTFRDDSDEDEANKRPRTPPPVSISKSLAAAAAASATAPTTTGNSKLKQPIPSLNEPLLNNNSKKSSVDGKYVLDTARSSVLLTDRSALVDRNSIPDVRLLKKKDQLPSLTTTTTASNNTDDNNKKKSPPKESNNNNNERLRFNQTIEPLKDPSAKQTTLPDPLSTATSIPSTNLSGNFDYLLAYIDASVVSEWLNRANRYLKKLSAWHRGAAAVSSSSELRFESYVLFSSFWIGSSRAFGDKQRRELIEIEYSIIYDEVVHAFQCGLESQQVTIGDLHGLLRAVFREYPLQLLSFRGTYLMLEYIDILSSERQDDYKRLLSDVKCRTVNKQYAQWLLSIRSFALINMCWSVVKFYRKTVQKQQEELEQELNKQQNKSKSDEKSSSQQELQKQTDEATATGSNNETTTTNLKSEFKKSTEDLVSQLSSSSSSSFGSSSASNNNNTTVNSASSSEKKKKKKRNRAGGGNKNNDVVDANFSILSKEIKFDYYWQAVLKNDLPDVLHYLISMKKIDPYQKDAQDRTLVFLAVMNEKPKILTYLVKRCPCIDLNEACDSGNTALHAAVNKGNLCLVEILLRANEDSNNSSGQQEQRLKSPSLTSASTSTSSSSTTTTDATLASSTGPRLDVNRANLKCMNATPLHLAVWNNYDEIALRLIEAKADPMLKMNGQSSAYDLARENNNEALADLMLEFSRRYLLTQDIDRNDNQ